MKPFKEIPPADYGRFLQAMREDHSLEYTLVSWQAIGEWFHRMRFTERVYTPESLKNWRKRFGMPVTQTARSSHGKPQPWTTNLMLQAWIGTSGRALSLPRWHPFRCEVEGRDPRLKPVGRPVHGRRNRQKRATAAELAARVSGSRNSA